jgi:hypothetical protein
MAVLAEDKIACYSLLYFRTSTKGNHALIYLVNIQNNAQGCQQNNVENCDNYENFI